MKETVLDLLMYLFENHMEEEPRLPAEPLRRELQKKLLTEGYDSDDISRAFSWLEGASDSPMLAAANPPKPNSFRLYTDEEQAVLDMEARGFLLQLEEIGVLSTTTREAVIERALALDHPDMDLDDIKWVVMLVLFARPGEEAAFAWMEELVFAETTDLLH